MRQVRIITGAVLVALLALIVTAASGQDSSVTLTYDPDHPIIEHGARGAWDGQYTDPGAAIYYEGQFHIFRNGFVGFPAWAGAVIDRS